MIDDLPQNIRESVKSFIKKSSNSYSNYSVTVENGNYVIKITKPGNVPGAWADYYKVLDSDGATINVYKNSFDNLGNLVHTKGKF